MDRQQQAAGLALLDRRPANGCLVEKVPLQLPSCYLKESLQAPSSPLLHQCPPSLLVPSHELTNIRWNIPQTYKRSESSLTHLSFMPFLFSLLECNFLNYFRLLFSLPFSSPSSVDLAPPLHCNHFRWVTDDLGSNKIELILAKLLKQSLACSVCICL